MSWAEAAAVFSVGVSVGIWVQQVLVDREVRAMHRRLMEVEFRNTDLTAELLAARRDEAAGTGSEGER